MENCRLRRATPADAEPLAAVYRSAYAQNRRLGFSAKAESVTADEVDEWIRDARVFVATIDGEVVGGVRLEATDADRAKLSRLGVREDWKGRGIGSRLVDRAEDAARDSGYGTSWLTTPPSTPFYPRSTAIAATRRRVRFPWSTATTTRSSWRNRSDPRESRVD